MGRRKKAAHFILLHFLKYIITPLEKRDNLEESSHR
jgi:hypothetical protein